MADLDRSGIPGKAAEPSPDPSQTTIDPDQITHELRGRLADAARARMDRTQNDVQRLLKIDEALTSKWEELETFRPVREEITSLEASLATALKSLNPDETPTSSYLPQLDTREKVLRQECMELTKEKGNLLKDEHVNRAYNAEKVLLEFLESSKPQIAQFTAELAEAIHEHNEYMGVITRATAITDKATADFQKQATQICEKRKLSAELRTQIVSLCSDVLTKEEKRLANKIVHITLPVATQELNRFLDRIQDTEQTQKFVTASFADRINELNFPFLKRAAKREIIAAFEDAFTKAFAADVPHSDKVSAFKAIGRKTWGEINTKNWSLTWEALLPKIQLFIEEAQNASDEYARGVRDVQAGRKLGEALLTAFSNGLVQSLIKLDRSFGVSSDRLRSECQRRSGWGEPLKAIGYLIEMSKAQMKFFR